MLTDRDREVLTWIEEYRAISLQQANQIFFNDIYVSCQRRLQQLEELGLLKSYINSVTGEKIYYKDKKLSAHDLFIYDFIKEIYRLGGTLRKMKVQPRFLKDNVRPDGFIEFEYKENVYFIILEVDWTHFTDNSKMQLYEKLYREEELKERCYGTFPIVVIARPTNSIRYNSNNFNVVYTGLDYKSLQQLLFV